MGKIKECLNCYNTKLKYSHQFMFVVEFEENAVNHRKDIFCV